MRKDTHGRELSQQKSLPVSYLRDTHDATEQHTEGTTKTRGSLYSFHK